MNCFGIILIRFLWLQVFTVLSLKEKDYEEEVKQFQSTEAV